MDSSQLWERFTLVRLALIYRGRALPVKLGGFVPLPAPLMLTMLGQTALYVLATEVTKKYFYSRRENAIA